MTVEFIKRHLQHPTHWVQGYASKKYTLKKYFVIVFLLLAVNGNAQQEVKPADLAHLSNPNFRLLQAKLLQWQTSKFIMNPDMFDSEEWQQDKVWVDEKERTLRIRINPFVADETGPTTKWLVTAIIPIDSIISITESRRDSALEIKTGKWAIAVFQTENMYPAGKDDRRLIYCSLDKVRNLAGELDSIIAAIKEEKQLPVKKEN